MTDSQARQHNNYSALFSREPLSGNPCQNGYNTGMSAKRKHSGDDGTTDILGDERISKFHPRIETLGALDEASAALGLARSLIEADKTAELILEIQKQLYILMAEIATPDAKSSRPATLQPSHLEWIDTITRELENQVELPPEFILPGDSVAGAALALARTAVRRAERRIAELVHRKEEKNNLILPWMNRLSSLLFLLEVSTIRASGMEPTTAKQKEDLPEN
jgi:cob(I)alamin adenosyltransferase